MWANVIHLLLQWRTPISGRIIWWCRASFSGPSPAANSVGVGEGHLFSRCPSLILRAPHLVGIFYLKVGGLQWQNIGFYLPWPNHTRLILCAKLNLFARVRISNKLTSQPILSNDYCGFWHSRWIVWDTLKGFRYLPRLWSLFVGKPRNSVIQE